MTDHIISAHLNIYLIKALDTVYALCRRNHGWPYT